MAILCFILISYHHHVNLAIQLLALTMFNKILYFKFCVVFNDVLPFIYLYC